MANDDYFVIVYRLLSYFYECLKNGKNPIMVEFRSEALGINNIYWCYVMDDLSANGHINGIYEPVSTLSVERALTKLRITSKGIEYMYTNPLMLKAKESVEIINEVVQDLKDGLYGNKN